MSIVDFTYSFTVDGVEQTAVTSQAVWLSRAFYYGDGKPAPARSTKTPSQVGPWRVAGLSAVTADVVDDPNPCHETTYTAAEDETADCSTAHGVLEQLSEVARVGNFFGAVCLSGGDRTTIGADVDLATVGTQFPGITDVTELPDMLGLGEDKNDRIPAPLSEHRVTIAGEDYVFVFASVGHGGLLVPEAGVRLISLQKAAS